MIQEENSKRPAGDPVPGQCWARVLQAVLWCCLAVALLQAAVCLGSLAVLRRLEHGLEPFDLADRVDRIQSLVGLLRVGSVALVPPIFVVWLCAIVRHKKALGFGELAVRQRSIVAGFLLPGLNFFLPPLLIARLLRSLDRSLPSPLPMPRHATRDRPRLGLFWSAWLACLALDLLARCAVARPDWYWWLDLAFGVWFVSALLCGVAAGASIQVTRWVNRRVFERIQILSLRQLTSAARDTKD